MFVSTELTVESQTPPKSEESLELSDKSLCENKVDAGTHLILRQTDMNLLRLACVRARKVALAYAGGNLTTFGHLLSIPHARLEQPVRDCFIFGFFPRVFSIAARGRRSERGDKVFFQTGELQFHLGEFASKHA